MGIRDKIALMHERIYAAVMGATIPDDEIVAVDEGRPITMKQFREMLRDGRLRID